MATQTKDLTKGEYDLFRKLVYAKSGIELGDQKMQLVRARLGKRVRTGGYKSFRDYYNHVERDPSGEELCKLLDAISTNTTHLFREIRHFEQMTEIIKGWASNQAWRAQNRELRIWSAGCSSGEEPHSIVMTAHDALSSHTDVELKVLATDLSVQMLSKAKLGMYEAHRVGTVPAAYKNRYLQKVQQNGQPHFQLKPELRRMITFSRFNLMTKAFPFRHGFHIIFCRNVMIYFDRQTQETLVNKYATHLRKGGYLMIGHSESLNGLNHPLSYVEPTVYKKG
jgi:chemotaxis protein methyltransferase CheR